MNIKKIRIEPINKQFKNASRYFAEGRLCIVIGIKYKSTIWYIKVLPGWIRGESSKLSIAG